MIIKRWYVWLLLTIFLSNPACKAVRTKEPGMHLLMQIDIEDAFCQLSRLQSHQLKGMLNKMSFPYGKMSFPDCRTILLTGDFSAKLSGMSDMFGEYFQDWESHITSSEIRLSMKPQSENEITNQLGQQTMEAIRGRLRALGVPRWGLLRIGSDRLLLEMGKLANPERVFSMLRIGGMIEFRLVDAGPMESEADALNLYPGGVPEDLELLKADQKRTERGYYLVQVEPVLIGRDINEAFRSKDEYGHPVIILTFNDDASRRLQRITSGNIGKGMAIVIDQRIVSTSIIQEAFSKDCIIRGQYTVEEVDDMVLLLKSALPASIRYLEQMMINPLLGNYYFPNGGFIFIVGFATETTSEKLYKALRQANLKAEEIQQLGKGNRFAIFIKNKAAEEIDRGEQLAITVRNALSALSPLALLSDGSIPDWSSEKIWPSKSND